MRRTRSKMPSNHSTSVCRRFFMALIAFVFVGAAAFCFSMALNAFVFGGAAAAAVAFIVIAMR